MKRVAALYLPEWPIERLWRVEPNLAPPPEPKPARAAFDALTATVAAERARACSVPRGGGWRPGARWAKAGGAPPTGEAVPGVPLVTTQRVGSRIEIAAASIAARALGAVPGLTLTSARAVNPQLIARAADPDGDRADLMRLAIGLALRWSPSVALDGDDGLAIDVSGVAHLHGGEEAMARRLIRLMARLGFTARVAVADTLGAAHALSRHGRRLCLCPPGGQKAMLAPLPPAALRLAPEQLDLLRTLGIATIGQIAAMPRAPLARRFGQLLGRLDAALGDVAEPLDPIVPPASIAVVQRFVEPIATPEAIERWLGDLAPRLTHALASAGVGARRIELIADRVDHVPQHIRIGLARPSRDPVHILKLLVRRIETIEPGYGIDAMTLHVRSADPLGPTSFLERLDEATAPDLAPLIDMLATRRAATWRATPLESEVPERSVGRREVLDAPAGVKPRSRIDDVGQLERLGALDPWTPLWPRPARLLARPEEVDHVIAELPDQPPRRFTWRGVTHRIVRADGPERILGEWWRRRSEAQAVRDYFRVEDDTGARFWLYRRGDGERAASGDLRWFLHGWFG